MNVATNGSVAAATTVAPPTWIERLPRRPLCDVPWLGRSVVLSDGGVHFCCFSEAVVGNVNEQPLQAIWRGEKMQRIRASLAQQRLPPECRSNACPFFRGDSHHYIIDRMNGGRDDGPAGGVDPRDALRERFRASELLVEPVCAVPGGKLRVALRLEYPDDALAVDTFVGATFPDGRLRFLPELTEYPLPCGRRLGFGPGRHVHSIDVVETTIDATIPRGTYEFCAAVFFADSNPMIASNCLWSARRSITIEGGGR